MPKYLIAPRKFYTSMINLVYCLIYRLKLLVYTSLYDSWLSVSDPKTFKRLIVTISGYSYVQANKLRLKSFQHFHLVFVFVYTCRLKAKWKMVYSIVLAAPTC